MPRFNAGCPIPRRSPIWQTTALRARFTHQETDRFADGIAAFLAPCRIVLALLVFQLFDAPEKFALGHCQALLLQDPQAGRALLSNSVKRHAL